jgi:GT2 family glycosyltransferase
MQLPKVSIIIINYNGKHHLESCLESLLKINYNNTEIIIVDNNSTDDSVNFVSKNFPDVILIRLNENKGFAEPNNIASKVATGDLLLFLNNDTIVTPSFISEMIKPIQQDSDIGICQSLLLKPDESIDSSGDFIDTLGVVYNSKTQISEIREISSARGASMMIKKNLFEQLEGFDKKFYFSFEDVDLSWRCWIAGYKVLIIPKSIVYHLGGQTYQKVKNSMAFHGFKNQLSMKITNFESSLVLKNMLKFFIIYGSRELKIWFDYKIYGKTKLSSTKYENNIAPNPSFKIIFNSILWVVNNQKYLIQKQRKVNSTRKISSKQLEKMNILCKKYF